jgi:hypothetical protein
MTTLDVLKYAGGALAALSFGFGIYQKMAAGRWRTMTALDWAATIVGVAAALVGFYSARLQRAQADADAARSQAQHRREVLAQTPLRDLTLEWTFDKVPAGTGANDDRRACDSDHQPRDSVKRNEVYPFLAALGGRRRDRGNVVLLTALDAESANVLPLGLLDVAPPKDEDGLAWHDTTPEQLKDVAATIDFAQDLDQCLDLVLRRVEAPVVQRPRRCEVGAALARAGDRVVIHWTLGPPCIAAGVDRADATLAPTAQLPERLAMVLLTEIDDFPFDPKNFAVTGNTLPWTPRTTAVNDYRDHSRLRLVTNNPNAVGDAATYDMRPYRPYLVGGKSGGAQVAHAYPLATTWIGSRLPE